MKRVWKNIVAAACTAIMITLAAGSVNAYAAYYVSPWTYDLSPDSETAFQGGSLGENGEAIGGMNRFGHFETSAKDREGYVMINSNKKLAMQVFDDEERPYYKIYQTGSRAGITGGGVTLDYTQNNGGVHYGFNSTNHMGGNIYGKATFSIDFKLDKNEYWYAENEKRASYDGAWRIFGNNSPTNANTAALFGISQRDRYDNETDNINRYVVGLGGVYSNTLPNAQFAFLTFGNWYTLKMDVDVANSEVTYSVYNSDNVLIKSYTGEFNNPCDFVAPVISMSQITAHGIDYSFSNIKVTRETFISKNAAISSDENNVTASVSVAGDVWYKESKYNTDSLNTDSPRLILALYDKTSGKLISVNVSDAEEIAGKEAFDSQPQYTDISVSVPKPTSDYEARAFLWSSLDDMGAYTKIITEE